MKLLSTRSLRRTLSIDELLRVRTPVFLYGVVTELTTVEGDGVGTALSINNYGQVAGGSGACSTFNPQFLIPIHPLHPVVWEKDGTAIEIPSLGWG